MAENLENGEKIFAAKEAYVLMQNEYRISRNIRALWFFSHLNKVVTISPKTAKDDCANEIEIISAIPKDGENCSTEQKCYSVRIVPDTHIIFLSARYRLVFCLDLSPSVATVDVQRGVVLFDDVYPTLKQSLISVSQPFLIPGSQFYFMPELHVTVLAHIPNCPSGISQVLIQGWLLTSENVECLLTEIEKCLHEVEERLKNATAKVYEEHNKLKLSYGNISRTVIEDTPDPSKVIKTPHVLTSDLSTLNLMRYGILALQLLPENSSAGIVVITDGIISFPSTQMLDSLLAQLRNSTISCSFLQLGSPYHPFACFGHVPYVELMQFISSSTCGAYFPSSENYMLNPKSCEVNDYHKAFLFWSFQNNKLADFFDVYERPPISESHWTVNNPHFFSVANQSRVRKKHAEGNLKVSWESILSCRLREGYTVKNVLVDEGKNIIEVRLLLPWNLSTNVEYVIKSNLVNQRNITPGCYYEVVVDGCYMFLHDVSCSDKKPIKSIYRTAVINQFWNYIKNLSHTDQILVQLHSFSHNPANYTIPESIKNGVPLFYLPVNSTTPCLSSKNVAHTAFTTFWKPLCMLDINVWHKWMHTHRIGVILQHDMPLPKNLHLPNTSGRYVHIQCRQATTALNSLLSEYSSFVLVENHSYIKFLYSESDKPPSSFFVIRVTSKAPCMVIRLAFLGGLPGYERNEIFKDLRDKILNLKLQKRTAAKDHSLQSPDSSVRSPGSGMFDTGCCFLLRKPVEKILIRYQKLPTNFMTSVTDTSCSAHVSHLSQQLTEHLSTNMMVTLSKYLHHQRWIWTMQSSPNISLALPAVSKMLTVLTKIRLQEGFHFSYSSFGIICMVLEIPMKTIPETESKKSLELEQESHPCIVQYLLFPPHTNTTFKDSMSDDEDTELPEADGELQLITECWVEPQHGLSVSSAPVLNNLNNLTYEEISAALHTEDRECISVLTTFEHLLMMCQAKENSLHDQSPLHSSVNSISHTKTAAISSVPDTAFFSQALEQVIDSSIYIIPYSFNLMSLLPKCHQTELLFSTFYQDASVNQPNPLHNEPNDILFEFLLQNISLYHDQEVSLSIHDCVSFVSQVHLRERDTSNAPLVPFAHHTFCLDSSTSKRTSSKKCQCQPSSKCCCLQSETKQNFESKSNNKDIAADVSNIEENIPKWRCFLKGCSPSHFLMTIVPATYSNLKKLLNDNSESHINADVSSSQNSVNNMSRSNAVFSTEAPHSLLQSDEFKELSSSKDEIVKETTSLKSSSIFPIYVYDCIQASVTSQLVERESRPCYDDSYESHAFRVENSASNIDEILSVKSDSTCDDYKRKRKKKYDKSSLKCHRSLLDKCYAKTFAYAVYRSLALDMHVHKFDVITTIDEICEESLVQIDITDFIFMICGHVKDFTMKCSLRQMHTASEQKSNEIMQNKSDGDSNIASERSPGKSCFPLALLQKYQPCEQLQQKHLDIKKRFFKILQEFLKKIPSCPEYHIFCTRMETNDEESANNSAAFECANENEANVQNTTAEADAHFENESNKGSNMENPEDNTSLHSHLNTQSSLSSLEHDPSTDFAQNVALAPPLFVHMSCSLKSRNVTMSCAMSSLPTCLGDFVQCIDPQFTEIDLDDIQINLDIACLTVPRNIESPLVSQHRQYSTSFSSSSPIPESDRFKPTFPENEEEEDSSSECASDTMQTYPLRNIPSFQRERVHECINKINWLLQDEKAAAALHSYPVTSELLNMVTSFVDFSKNDSCCMVNEVPLKFVFGAENSLDKFVQAFKRMKLQGYHLNEVDNFYYLVLDAEFSKKENHFFSSLEPPIGLTDKCMIIQTNPHCDDSTALNKISTEANNSLVFPNKDQSFLVEKIDMSGVEDEYKSYELPKNEYFGRSDFCVVRKKRQLQRNIQDDTETEDGNESISSRTKFVKKGTLKSTSERSHYKKYSMSTAPTIYNENLLVSRRAYSMPSNLNLVGELPVFQDAPNQSCRRLSLSLGNDINPNFDHHSKSDQLMEPEFEALASPPLKESSPLQNSASHFWNSQSISSIPFSSKFHGPGSTSSPFVYSDAEFTSAIESCRFSNTEDGYDGDSSDSGSEWDWLSTLDTRRPILPNFWLIMTVESSKVVIYFHIRHRDKEDEELIQSKAVLAQVITVIANICKEVNQTLLLQSLHESRMCNQLLVPEENDDIWKKIKIDTLSTTLDSNRSLSGDDENVYSDVQSKFMEANQNFLPGTFSCEVVWITHFRLHHRLTSGHTSTHVSRGIQALRTVLNAFSVNNRENMFVYQERSGSVFYLRLQEVYCDEEHTTGTVRIDDSSSLMGSCCFGMQNLSSQKRFVDFDIENEFRPRVNSGQSDTDQQDGLSVGSGMKTSQKCIALYVHGIGEVGTEIKEDLVQVLQNRLNEGVLDMIIMMLSRNPLCKLTPEDIQFIQNPNQPPVSEINFTIPVKLLCHSHSIHVYLRQNLTHFLYNPKYTDSQKENHFKAYSRNPVEWNQVDDNDIFLYNSLQASGCSGSKGIACIVLTLVTGQGHPYQNLGNAAPSSSAYQDGLSENDFEELTYTIQHTIKKERTPGPVALFRFQIWVVGKVSLEHIETRLHSAVRHALWDLLIEYRALTAPITEASIQEDLFCCSEPSTPVRVRRSGRANVDHNLKTKDFTSLLTSSKEISSSVPDIAAKVQSPPSTLQDIFKFNNGSKSAKAEFYTELPTQGSVASSTSPRVPDIDKNNLNYLFHSVMNSFLQFGTKLGCPAVLKHTFTISSRHSIPIVLKEIQSLVKSFSRDLSTRIFLRITNTMNADTEFVPFNVACSSKTSSDCSDEVSIKPGMRQSFIIIGRNEQQWRAYTGHSDFTKFQDAYKDALKRCQRFQTHVCCSKSSDKYQESTPTSPTSINRSNSASATLSSPRVKSPGTQSSDTSSVQLSSSTSVTYVPRQRLLLILAEDRELTIFLYNWAQDVTTNLLKQFKKLVQFHSYRDSLLCSLVSQKMGLFHGQSLSYSLEKAEKAEKIEQSGRKISDGCVGITWNFVDLLIHHHSPPRESQNSSSGSRSSIVLPSVLEVLKNARPPTPLHLSKEGAVNDPVKKYGMQLQSIRHAHRRDLQDLYTMWQTRGTSFNSACIDRMLLLLKRVARFSHYCLTPILFSPSWRWKVAPVRDHTLEPLDHHINAPDRSPSDSSLLSRSRHSSGSSAKNVDGVSTTSSNSTLARSRRTSGAALPSSGQSSPKLRMKNPSEETWHQTICNHYLQEYIQYLHTLGFVSLQTRDLPRTSSSRKSGENEDGKPSKTLIGPFSHSKSNIYGTPVHYLTKFLLGGFLVFEVGLCDPYAYAHLYTVDCRRLHACSTRTLSSQFTSAFLDEIDKIRALMHLHSFTYDYHLRTIHSYISGRQLIFRHGYHLTSFLDDFIKYYQKSPNGARNLLYAGSLIIPDIQMSDHQLYNYIISHNQLYGMTVLRMVPIIQDSSAMMDTEFVLVELSAHKASYKDANDVCQMGSFDIGLLINHNTMDTTSDKNLLVLNYYIILTSQRELYPKLSNFGTALGSFQTVRFAPALSSGSSRKTSTVSAVMDKFESSGEETSSNSTDSRSKYSTYARGMCDEEVTYLGYFSSQETMMQVVLKNQAEAAQIHLKAVVHRAAVHCRRDFLWSSLLPRSTKDECASRDSHGSNISYPEFSELLHLVSLVPLSDIDEKLMPFMNMHISWYQSLVSVLKMKYGDLHREFSYPDGNVHYTVVTHPRCPDSFMLLSVDLQSKRAELGLAIREPLPETDHTPEKPNQRLLSLQSLVEEFVNACCFHLWSSIVN